MEVPRSILRASSPLKRLQFGYFTLSKRYLEYIEDEEELKTVLKVCLFSSVFVRMLKISQKLSFAFILGGQ